MDDVDGRIDSLRASATLRRPHAWRRLAMSLAATLPLAAFSPGLSLATSGLALAVCAATLWGQRAFPAGPGALTFTRDEVVWEPARGGPWSRSRDDVVAGWHEPSADGRERVVLVTRDGDELTVDLPDEPTARRALDAAGVGVRQRTLAFETRSPWVRMAAFAAALVTGFVALSLMLLTVLSFMVFPWVGVMMLLPLAATTLLTVVMLRPVDTLEVLVGDDGVTVRGELEDRFVPYARVADLEDAPDGVTLRLDDDTRVAVSGPRLRRGRRAALVERLRDALDAHRRAEATERTRDLLARGGTPFAAWREALLARARGEGVYRAGAVDAAELGAVLDDPTAPAAQRAAAAMLLTSLDDAPDARARVRVAADATASDPLRLALERVLDDGLDERDWMRLERAAARR